MQVRVRTNFAPYKSAGDRSGAAHAVIRRLFDVGAVFRVELRGTRGTAAVLVIFLWDFSGNPLDKCLNMRYTIVKAMRRGMIHDDSTERWRLMRAI